jgi:hypothetical protein
MANNLARWRYEDRIRKALDKVYEPLMDAERIELRKELKTFEDLEESEAAGMRLLAYESFNTRLKAIRLDMSIQLNEAMAEYDRGNMLSEFFIQLKAVNSFGTQLEKLDEEIKRSHGDWRK